MEHGLASSAAIVEDGAVTGQKIALRSEFGGNELELAQHCLIFLRGIVERGKVFSRTDQNMCRRLRVDIFKREYLVILVYHFRRNLLGSDVAKQTIGVHHFTPEGAASSSRTTNGVKPSLLRS